MEFEFLPAQKDFMLIPKSNYDRDIALYQGGYGSGKTFVGSAIGIFLCLQYPGILGLVGAQTYTLVRDTTQRQYFEHLDNMGFKAGVHYKWNASEEKITFANGSEVMFRHLQDPNKIKSLNLGFIEIEEMSDTLESTFKMLVSRLRQKVKPEWKAKGFKYRLFGHTNPEQSKGWIYKYFVEQKQPYFRLIQAPTTQNKFLSKEYVESMRDLYDEQYYRINVLGEFGDYTSGLVVKNFTSDNVKQLNYCPDLPLHLTWDFNVDPMSCILAHKTDKKIFYFDEVILENSTSQQTIDEVIRRYPNHKSDIIINGDASGDNRSTQSEYSNYIIIRNALKKHYPHKKIKFDIPARNPAIMDRILAFNQMVYNDNGERNLFVSPKCERLLYNVKNLMFKIGTFVVDVPTYSQIKTNPLLKFLEHPYDAASYLAWFYFPIKRAKIEKN